MSIRFFAALLALLTVTSPLSAAPVIDAGTHYLQPGATAQIAVSVSGGDAVAGVDLWVQVGDGGEANGGSNTAPTITALDIIGPGTLFHASNKGADPLPAGGLMWTDSTETDKTKAPTLPAGGTLAFLTVNTSGATAGQSYPLRLKGVGAGMMPPAGADTTLYSLQGIALPAAVSDGRIVILHTMTWNAPADGNWTDPSWQGSPPTFPDDAADVLIGTPRTVTVTGTQQAHSVAVVGGGHLLISSGSLTVIDGISGAGNTTVNGSLTADSIMCNTLTIGAGSSVTIRPTATGGAASPVPEPGTWVLIGTALLGLLAFRRRC